jgi:hypothetical protein
MNEMVTTPSLIKIRPLIKDLGCRDMQVYINKHKDLVKILH